MSLFGSSGIRRIADRNLIEIALRAGLALGRLHKRVVVGRDTRTSGGALKHALVSGLLSSGARCYDGGVLPTPTLAVAARDFDIGVMLTASHNPPEYNGIKIFNPDGSSYVSAQQQELERMITNPFPTAPWDRVEPDCIRLEAAIERHIEHIMAQTGATATKKTRVVVDCACGAGAVITPVLLRKLNCEVIGLNTNTSGFFPHDVEPIERNLQDLIRICGELRAFGIAHDGDADRMMAVDEEGRFIPGDKMLVLLARHIQARDVVTTVDASIIVEESGFKTTRTRVGDTYVSEQLSNSGDFGGEPSGAWIFPRNSLCPDGIFAAATLVSIAATEKLSDLVDAIPQYCVLRGSLDLSQRKTNDEELISKTQPLSVDGTDGLKLLFDDGWALVRPSGTEPKIRLTVEAKSDARAHQIYDRVLHAMGTEMPQGGQSS